MCIRDSLRTSYDFLSGCKSYIVDGIMKLEDDRLKVDFYQKILELGNEFDQFILDTLKDLPKSEIKMAIKNYLSQHSENKEKLICLVNHLKYWKRSGELRVLLGTTRDNFEIQLVQNPLFRALQKFKIDDGTKDLFDQVVLERAY
eukprot:TRINITY_DN1174_c0_g1_i2.p1 TRINITY_DN1174_c0_g1~~TRINITY_DN1174_c0_g1_i2.p1  ORF type:complete len:145 (+),score=31.22 TRINITY_DN1174_c0_g1_i2:64-498(+)